MTRSLLVVLVALALVGLLVLVSFVSAPRVKSTQARKWQPVPQLDFQRFAVTPLDRPVRRETHRSATKAPEPSVRPSIRPKPTPSGGTIPDFVAERGVAGIATWFCQGTVGCTVGYPASGMFAAAGPVLRLGNWRGRLVTVSIAGRSVVVRLVDWCACSGHLIDLYRSAFSRLAAPSVGIVEVTVSW